MKIFIACMLILSTVLFYQACGEQTFTESDEYSGSGITSDPQDVDFQDIEGSDYSGSEEFDLTEQSDGEVISAALIGSDGVTVNQDDNCESDCERDLECSSLATSDLISSCTAQCSRTPPGICAPLEVEGDPYVLSSFTIPAGYKKMSVTFKGLVHQSTMVIEGPNLRLSFYPSGFEQYKNGVFNYGGKVRDENGDFLSKDEKRVDYNHPTVDIQTYDDDGLESEFIPLRWKRAEVLSLSFYMVSDIDLSEPIYLLLGSHKGKRGVLKSSVYDNYLPNGQLSFILDYYYGGTTTDWVGGQNGEEETYKTYSIVETQFDIYYKPGRNDLSQDFEELTNE